MERRQQPVELRERYGPLGKCPAFPTRPRRQAKTGIDTSAPHLDQPGLADRIIVERAVTRR